MIGNAKPSERPEAPGSMPQGVTMAGNRDRQEGPRFATGWRTTPQSGHGRTSRRSSSRWPTACLRCDFEFHSIRMIGPNGVRTRLQASILGRVAMSEGDEDDNSTPYTLWTCRLRTGCCCKS